MNRIWLAWAAVVLGCNLDAGPKPPPVEIGDNPDETDAVDQPSSDAGNVSTDATGPSATPTVAQPGADGGSSAAPGSRPTGGDAGSGTGSRDASVSYPGVDLDEVDPVVVDPVEAAAPVCGVGAAWSALRALGDAKDVHADRLLSVTPDGKSWVFGVRKELATLAPSLDAGPTSDAGADAATPAVDPFDYYLLDLPGAPRMLELSAELDPGRGAALSPDGLRLIVVNDVPSNMSELRRERRGDEFGSPNEEPFTRLRGAALQTGYAYENPTFSASGDSLYVSAKVRDVHQIRQLTLSDGRWDTAWLMNDLQRLLADPWSVSVSSASGDDRTVFLWDSAQQRALVADRSEFGEPTGDLEPIAFGNPLFVNDDCTRLFTLDDAGIPAFAQRQ